MKKIKLIMFAILTGGLTYFAIKLTMFIKTKLKFVKKGVVIVD